MYCHHLFPSGADVIQMDGRDSFIDGVEVITEYQLFQIRKEREVWESSSFIDPLEALEEMMGDSIVGD